jgi:Ala-tRNA(Pro) deacylase
MKIPSLKRLLRPAEENPPCQVESLLRDKHIAFEHHHHEAAYTAQEVAAAEHVPGRYMAKVVIAFADERMVMLALPAPEKVNLLKLADQMCTEDVRLASEEEFAERFSDCEIGAMPPFGNVYGLPVYIDKTLARDDHIVFQAGTHTDTIEMAYGDYVRLVHPRVADFAYAS